jgi:hypothetical protein
MPKPTRSKISQFLGGWSLITSLRNAAEQELGDTIDNSQVGDRLKCKINYLKQL